MLPASLPFAVLRKTGRELQYPRHRNRTFPLYPECPQLIHKQHVPFPFLQFHNGNLDQFTTHFLKTSKQRATHPFPYRWTIGVDGLVLVKEGGFFRVPAGGGTGVVAGVDHGNVIFQKGEDRVRA